MEQVKLLWQGPYQVDQALKSAASEGWGVYAICRKWGVAPEKVLYIGRAYWQNFRIRLPQHSWIAETWGTVRVRFAEIEPEPGRIASRKRTDDVEALLIYSLQPARNTHGKNTYRGRELLIINSGRRGPIPQRVAS